MPQNLIRIRLTGPQTGLGVRAFPGRTRPQGDRTARTSSRQRNRHWQVQQQAGRKTPPSPPLHDSWLAVPSGHSQAPASRRCKGRVALGSSIASHASCIVCVSRSARPVMNNRAAAGGRSAPSAAADHCSQFLTRTTPPALRRTTEPAFACLRLCQTTALADNYARRMKPPPLRPPLTRHRQRRQCAVGDTRSSWRQRRPPLWWHRAALRRGRVRRIRAAHGVVVGIGGVGSWAAGGAGTPAWGG